MDCTNEKTQNWKKNLQRITNSPRSGESFAVLVLRHFWRVKFMPSQPVINGNITGGVNFPFLRMIVGEGGTILHKELVMRKL